MMELMMLLANGLSEETVTQYLEDALKEHRLLGTKETKGKLTMHCQLFLCKHFTEEKDVMDVIEDIRMADKTKDLLIPTKS